ncbi:hypothetical protein C1645_877494 [Glomus cerebriforme]|uniref:MARVEL domain-containing protein n=1 Tax=Glomus cerebriforme TaxID=658196 RepID=A0A397SQ15_9GLOM|nr:hypothetical protein C1645_877494 [Glomus cerebriforme]
MVFSVERKTFLTWRIIQFWMLFSIFILEIVQLSGYYGYYWNKPANDQIRIWISLGISFAIIGYSLNKFDHKWKNGPHKGDYLLDWILLATWNIHSFLNVVPAVFGNGLICRAGPKNPYQITTHNEQMRCHLFIVSTVFSFLALFTAIVTLTLSKVRWKNRNLIPSSSRGYKSYIIQNGSLDNGQPALFFYSKNNSHYGKNISKLRNSIIKSPSSSFPINISIPEPEIAAIAKTSKDIPITANDEKNENEILKY